MWVSAFFAVLVRLVVLIWLNAVTLVVVVIGLCVAVIWLGFRCWLILLGVCDIC